MGGVDKSDLQIRTEKFYQWLRTTIKLNNRIIPTGLLTEQQVPALTNACNNDRDRALIALMYGIVPRPSELLRLRVSKVVADCETEVQCSHA